MRILIMTGAGATNFYRLGWVNAFRKLGHQVAFWNIEQVSAFDAFNEFEPEIFIGSTWQLTRAIVKCIEKRPHLKILLSAPNWSEEDGEVGKEFPIQFATEEEIQLVLDLKEKTNKPEYVFCQYSQRYADQTHSYWNTVGCKPLGILLAADTNDFYPTKTKKFENDIGFIGGYWDYKAKHLREYLVNICYPNTELKIKIFGFGGWPVPNFVGQISTENMRHLYANSIISPNIFEPHSPALGYDVNQRAYQIAACGGFQLSQRVESMESDVFSDGGVVYVDDPSDFLEKTRYYIAHPNERIPYIKKGIETIFKGHTFIHRVALMFNRLGLFGEEKEALKLADAEYEQWIKDGLYV